VLLGWDAEACPCFDLQTRELNSEWLWRERVGWDECTLSRVVCCWGGMLGWS
jgi:hypothetical protein